MHLAQHHFQAHCRYFESELHFALSSLIDHVYGYLDIQLDDDALWNGTVSVVSASGVMPDGLAFDFDQVDERPAPLRVADFLRASSGEGEVVYLAIPAYRPGQANCELQAADGQRRRFSATPASFFDETSGVDERELQLARRNVELVAKGSLQDGLVGMPLAKVRADGSGHFIYDPLFVPPLLRVGASRRLKALLDGMLEILEAKGTALKQQPTSLALSEMATHEVMGLWLTHAVFSGVAPLRHHTEFGRSHPRDVYKDLARLAGALCTFSLESDTSGIPLYDHDRLGDVFGALDRHIRRHLEVVIPQQSFSVALKQSTANLLVGPLQDARALERAEWILRIRSAAPVGKVISEAPRTVKVCSAEDVMRLVADANPALILEHLQVPPAAISPRVGSQYFRLRRQGPSWQLIHHRKTVGVYIPDALLEAEVELVVIPE
jgi:type VI secretion system protein ImpJ